LASALARFLTLGEGSSRQTVPGQIHWQQQCVRSEGTLSGSHRFAHLAVTGHSGVTRRLAVDGQQVIDQALRLQGGSERLILRSSVPGQAACLTLASAASWQVESIDVADIDSSGGQTIAPGDPAAYDSRDGGGNRNWFLDSFAMPVPVPVPVLGPDRSDLHDLAGCQASPELFQAAP